MKYNKKVGIILMSVSALVAIWSFLISECILCGVDGIPFWQNYRLNLMDNSVVLSYKYVFLICLSFFTVGFLFFLEALNAPYRNKFEKFLGNSVKSDDDQN